MKSKVIQRILVSLLTIAILLPTFIACSDTPADITADTGASTNAEDSTTVEESTEYVDTRFDGVDFGGKAFRVYSSVDTSDATNANALIEGSGELNGDIVNDAVYNRNISIEELLNIDLQFTQATFTYSTAQAGIRTLIMSASDDYDLIINDLMGLAPLTDENMFHNVFDAANFDYTKPYWYYDCMEDLQIIPGMMYLLAGDYFMDIIGSCHALFGNKNIINDFYGSPDYLYNLVLDGAWTVDAMTQVVEETYVDLDGNSAKNTGDQFGFTCVGTWGSVIPFLISTGTKFIDRSSGSPVFSFNDERAIEVVTMLGALINSNGTNTTAADTATARSHFANHQTVIVGYNRLGDLANMRDIDFDIAILPYPKLNIEQENYITSMHDTTEIGAIPMTVTDLNFVTTCIEVLTRETAKTVMPDYYETALKVKYTTDTMSATMIDIIHDSFGTVFPLAYNTVTGSIMLETFTNLIAANTTDFASAYSKKEKAAGKALEKLIESTLANNS